MKRWLAILGLTLASALAAPAAAFAHDAPEDEQSKWTMADWMLDTFFVFAGLAPLQIEEEDYYTPDWALEEEEWADVDADR